MEGKDTMEKETMENENTAVSLSRLIVSIRDYKPEYDWFLDKKDLCCYGLSRKERELNPKVYPSRCGSYLNFRENCVLIPEHVAEDISEAAAFLREWCEKNQISYEEDLDQYEDVRKDYWGY